MEKKKYSRASTAVTVVFILLSLVYLYPIVLVLINSFKTTSAVTETPFALPGRDTFAGVSNFINGISGGNYPFYRAVFNSAVITILSTALILLCTSMCAWYLIRVGDRVSRFFYYLFVLSMVVPFQMVMYTLPALADALGLTSPVGIVPVYLGFGCSLAVFLFSGFVRGVPKEIEEAASIDGCGPLRTFFSVVAPVMKPTFLSVGILELMWIWNDYLLPYKVLNITEYRTIPIQIQYLNAGYGIRDMGAIMAVILISILPVVLFYFLAQKHIVRGIAAGAVKG